MKYIIIPIFKYIYAITYLIIGILEYVLTILWFIGFKEANKKWVRQFTEYKYIGDGEYHSFWKRLKYITTF